MKKNIFMYTVVATLLVGAATSCSKSNFDEDLIPPTEKDDSGVTDEPKSDEPAQPESTYSEQYRPLIHYTPAKNWINDPNGMVYINGIWHLFYQYNPNGNDWGNMSWGHATSTDLMHWKEQKVAMTRDELGDIFSGSAVCDKDNTAGFGAGTMVALYTSAGEHQQQSLAYSTDGINFTKYNANPVIANTVEPDFRDPKVMWDDERGQWVMALAMGWKHQIEFWASQNLKSWHKLSSFETSVSGCNRGQWECPDLLKMEYNGQEKWVLIVNVNPGGPILGSGTQYFVGDFDGEKFTADSREYPLWMDYGMDNYAGVTWSNAPEGRTVLIGWMNNWEYSGAVPASPWRSAMTLPRELKLIDYKGEPILASTVVKEIETIAGEWKEVTGQELGVSGPYQLQLEIDLASNASFVLANEHDDMLEMESNIGAGCFITKRKSTSGETSFNPKFCLPSMKAPYNTEGDKVIVDLFVDQSSVEAFTASGSMSQTNIVFPKSIYNRLEVKSGSVKAKVRPLKNVWQ